MTARRLALAWCWGSVCGLAVGWVYGSAVRDLAAFRALRRAEPGPGAPQEPSGHVGAVDLRIGPQEGARRLFTLDEVAAEFGVDLDDLPIPSQRDDEPCPQYSPGGGIPCSVTGTHTAHIFLGSCAPDAKDDADERIE